MCPVPLRRLLSARRGGDGVWGAGRRHHRRRPPRGDRAGQRGPGCWCPPPTPTRSRSRSCAALQDRRCRRASERPVGPGRCSASHGARPRSAPSTNYRRAPRRPLGTTHRAGERSGALAGRPEGGAKRPMEASGVEPWPDAGRAERSDPWRRADAHRRLRPSGGARRQPAPRHGCGGGRHAFEAWRRGRRWLPSTTRRRSSRRSAPSSAP